MIEWIRTSRLSIKKSLSGRVVTVAIGELVEAEEDAIARGEEEGGQHPGRAHVLHLREAARPKPVQGEPNRRYQLL